MINLACKIPVDVALACSGGKDSMSALEFLIRGRRNVTVAYFNHDTEHGDEAEDFLKDFCQTHTLGFVTARYKHDPSHSKPTEATWRDARYDFFKTLGMPVITAHHLKDAVEWWMFSSLRGNPSLIAPKRDDIPVLRPFITTHPDELHKHFCEYSFVEDPTNKEIEYTRNFIRHEMLGPALRVNPGLYTTIRNMYKRQDDA
jgi:tRNA(Ile)-lysidine synthase